MTRKAEPTGAQHTSHQETRRSRPARLVLRQQELSPSVPLHFQHRPGALQAPLSRGHVQWRAPAGAAGAPVRPRGQKAARGLEAEEARGVVERGGAGLGGGGWVGVGGG